MEEEEANITSVQSKLVGTIQHKPQSICNTPEQQSTFTGKTDTLITTQTHFQKIKNKTPIHSSNTPTSKESFSSPKKPRVLPSWMSQVEAPVSSKKKTTKREKTVVKKQGNP